jgi:hypothetical protein
LNTKSKDCERQNTKETNTIVTSLSTVRALRSLCVCAAAAASFDTPKESLMDKYELKLTLNDPLRISKEGEKHRQTFAQSAQNPNLEWMPEAVAEKCAAATEQLRAKIRGLGGEPVSDGSVNGAIGLDDHAILAECKRKQHMAKV